MVTKQDIKNYLEKGMLICGDSGEVLKKFDDNTIDLIYGDPIFNSDEVYNNIWKDFDEYREIFGFDDLCKDGIAGYILRMVPILKECYRVLKPTGSMYLHCDHHVGHYLKIEMDKIFGEGDMDKGANDKFITQITWRRCGSKGNAKFFANNSDYILFYSKDKQKTKFFTQYAEYRESTLNMHMHDDGDGRGRYASYDVSAPGGDGYRYDLGFDEKQPPGGYRWKKETMMEHIEKGNIILRPGKVPRQKRFISQSKGVPLDNIWTDVENVKSPDYSTQKPPELMKRILNASSKPHDVVLDPFCGGGPFIREAQDSYRIPIGIDISTQAIGITKRSLGNPDIKVFGMEKDDIADYVERNFTYEEKYEELRHMNANEFEEKMCLMFGGFSRKLKTDDGGVDGFKITPEKKIGIQVKRRDGVEGERYRLFKNDLREFNCDEGVIIAFSFNGGSTKRQKNDLYKQDKNYIPVELITVEDLFKREDVEKIDELVNPKPQLGRFFKRKNGAFGDPIY